LNPPVLTTVVILLIAGLVRGQEQPPSAAEVRAMLSRAVAADLLPFSGFEVAGRDNVRPCADGEGLSLGLAPGQRRVNGGLRAEVVVDAPWVEGDTVLYSWRFRLPAGVAADVPLQRWWIIGQWHVQPDPRQGESWDGRHGLSPPVCLGFGQVDGRDALVLNYGVEPRPVLPPIWFQREVWQTIEAEITWSRGAAGRALIRLAGRQVAAAHGPNMQNGYRHYFKFGQYRHPGIAGESWIDLAGLTIRRMR
jgi:hypothetical protein